MLDVSDEKRVAEEKRVVEELWAAAKVRVKLPMLTAKYFFEPKGPMPSHTSSRRSFHRFYMRSKAVLLQDTTIYGAYTTDVSRQGIGFLSPRQLMPKSKWTLKLPGGNEYELIVTRCRRESDNCYACGGRFATQSIPQSSSPAEATAEEPK
jgi:PilZ domain